MCVCVCVRAFLFSVVKRVGKCDAKIYFCAPIRVQTFLNQNMLTAAGLFAVCLCFQVAVINKAATTSSWWSQLVDHLILINIWCYEEIFKISDQTFRVIKTYIYRIIQLFHWTSLTREASVFTILYCANIYVNHQSLKNVKVPLS